MKIHLIKKQTLEEFAKLQPRSKSSLEDWTEKLKLADWQQPGDMKFTYNTADLLGKSSNRVVFDIGGNNYHMIKFANRVNSIQLISIEDGNSSFKIYRHKR